MYLSNGCAETLHIRTGLWEPSVVLNFEIRTSAFGASIKRRTTALMREIALSRRPNSGNWSAGSRERGKIGERAAEWIDSDGCRRKADTNLSIEYSLRIRVLSAGGGDDIAGWGIKEESWSNETSVWYRCNTGDTAITEMKKDGFVEQRNNWKLFKGELERRRRISESRPQLETDDELAEEPQEVGANGRKNLAASGGNEGGSGQQVGFQRCGVVAELFYYCIDGLLWECSGPPLRCEMKGQDITKSGKIRYTQTKITSCTEEFLPSWTRSRLITIAIQSLDAKVCVDTRSPSLLDWPQIVQLLRYGNGLTCAGESMASPGIGSVQAPF
ncbi:hypothetical protein C8J57DRAFT_1239981 [Mycena rebaudengoi]|nr:hypothetical protein C8J57DRAFT_1239981 [Mycena rebaudengoi]